MNSPPILESVLVLGLVDVQTGGNYDLALDFDPPHVSTLHQLKNAAFDSPSIKEPGGRLFFPPMDSSHLRGAETAGEAPQADPPSASA